MKRQLIYRSEVFDDLASAVRWYEDIDPKLGVDFKRQFKEATNFLKEHAEAFAPGRRSIRHLALRQFPYAVHFCITAEGVVVLLLFHSSRDPRELRQHLRERL